MRNRLAEGGSAVAAAHVLAIGRPLGDELIAGRFLVPHERHIIDFDPEQVTAPRRRLPAEPPAPAGSPRPR